MVCKYIEYCCLLMHSVAFLLTQTVVLLCQDCRDSNVACRRMQCVLGEIHPGQGVALRLYFRFWDHTFTEVLLQLILF